MLFRSELIDEKGLTPKRFASHFADFEYEFGADVLQADVFLARRKGDCDDYAVLAGHVLRHHGQNPRLIHVRMVGRVAHAVCYVTESKAYLDYNNRKYAINMERCGASLREIATQVADLIKPVFDVRRIRFGNPFRLEKEQDGTLLKFEYKIDDERVLKVKKTTMRTTKPQSKSFRWKIGRAHV